MNDSNSFSNSAQPRATLKLKVAARKPPKEAEPAARPEQSRAEQNSKANLKPGARWSDAHKERMQADMDSLVPR